MWTTEQNNYLQSKTNEISVTLQKPINEVVDQIVKLTIPADPVEHSGWDDMPENAKNMLIFLFSQLQLPVYVNSLVWSFDGLFYNVYFYQEGYKMGASVTNSFLILKYEAEIVWIPQLPVPIQNYITEHQLVVTKGIRSVNNPELLPNTEWWEAQIIKTTYTIIAGETYHFDGYGNLI